MCPVTKQPRVQFLKDDAEVFEHQPKRIYEVDTDTVDPVRTQVLD